MIATRRTADDRGLVLILFAIIIFVAMAVLALVVDGSKQSLALSTLQRAADAAALSGAKRMDGRLPGWRDAKKAAVLALKGNGILGVENAAFAGLRLDEGPARFDGSGARHSGSRGSAAGLEVTIERGVLWFDSQLNGPPTAQYPDGSPGGYRFVSLETDASETSELPIPNGIDAYFYSNAVRVNLRLNSLATSFGRILGIESFKNLERSAIAVTHEELEVPIAPFAVPLCALRLNNDPYAASNNQALDEIDFFKQCTRQGLATEGDPKKELPGLRNRTISTPLTDEIQRRREGLTRFESYLRPVYAKYDPAFGDNSCFDSNYKGDAHNCKDIPLFGVLGVPSPVPGREATARQVAEAFQRGVTARNGMYFAPLKDLREFGQNPSLSSIIAAALQDEATYSRHNESLLFMDVFTQPTGSTQPGALTRVAKRNAPVVKTTRPPCGQDPENRPCFTDDPATPGINEADPQYDLRVTWPTPYLATNPETGDEEPILGRLLMDRQITNTAQPYTRQPLDYTNPLCHHPSLPIDAMNAGDPRRHRVRKMLAPVIVPGTDARPNGKPVMYCNYEAVFTGYEEFTEASAVAPVPESLPVIVGFIPVFIYDFNLSDLDRVPAFQPPPGYQPPLFVGGDILIDPGISFPPSLGFPPNEWAPVSTPRYSDPSTGEVLIDRNAGELDVENQFLDEARNNANQYREDQEDWEDCVNENENSCPEGRPEPEGGSFFGIPEEFLRCFEFSYVEPEEVQGIAVGLNRAVQSVQEIVPDGCERTVTAPTGIQTVSFDCIQENGNAKKKKDAAFEVIDQILNENIPARPYTHCLPRENLGDSNDTKNRNDPEYYVQPFDTNRAGYGCGGVLFKTACGTGDGVERNTIFLPGGINWDQTTPALVAEDVQ